MDNSRRRLGLALLAAAVVLAPGSGERGGARSASDRAFGWCGSEADYARTGC